MKSTLKLLFVFVLFIGCSNDDDEAIDCDLVDIALPALHLRLVDNTGENLLESGSVDPETITIEADFGDASFVYIPEIENVEPNAAGSIIQHSLAVSLPTSLENFQYQISVAGYETVNLDMLAEENEEPCSDLSIPVGASVNGQALEQIEISEIEMLIVLPLIAQE
jgi:hypothetical protein